VTKRRSKYIALNHRRYAQRLVIQNFYQTLSCQLDDPEASHMLAQVFDLLIDFGVIEDEKRAETPSGKSAYGPGPHWEAAIVECDETFLELDVNGVERRSGRHIVDPGSFDATAVCPECLEPRPFDAAWVESANAWIHRSRSTGLACPSCGDSTPVDEWAYDPPIGFGNLSVTFWNWPSINREFINRVQRLVGTHVSLTEGQGDAITTLSTDDDRTTRPEPQ
jgi:hypothetical protein